MGPMPLNRCEEFLRQAKERALNSLDQTSPRLTALERGYRDGMKWRARRDQQRQDSEGPNHN